MSTTTMLWDCPECCDSSSGCVCPDVDLYMNPYGSTQILTRLEGCRWAGFVTLGLHCGGNIVIEVVCGVVTCDAWSSTTDTNCVSPASVNVVSNDPILVEIVFSGCEGCNTLPVTVSE